MAGNKWNSRKMAVYQPSGDYEYREADTVSFENDSQSQQESKQQYDIADLTLDTYREVKQLIKTIEQTYKVQLQKSFQELRYKINNRQFYVMFEPKLNTDALSDHKIPRSVLPILEPFVKDSHDEVAVALDAMLADLIVNSFGRTYKAEIEIKYKQYQMIDYLYIDLRRYYTDTAVQLKIIDSLQSQIINERQKFVKELQYVHEQAFYKSRVGGKYQPDFSDATAQAQEIFNLPEIQSIDLMRSRSTKEPRIDNQRLKILSQQCSIMQKQLADYDATKQRAAALYKKLEIAEGDLVEERAKFSAENAALKKQLDEALEQVKVNEVYARDAVAFMNLKMEENDRLLERVKSHDNLERQYSYIVYEYSKTKNRLDRVNKDLDKTNISMNERSVIAENELNAAINAKEQEVLDLQVENDELQRDNEELTRLVEELRQAAKAQTNQNTSQLGELESVLPSKSDRKSKKKLAPNMEDFAQQFPENGTYVAYPAYQEAFDSENAKYQFQDRESIQMVQNMAQFKQDFEARRQISGFNWMAESVDETMKRQMSNIQDFRSRLMGYQIKELPQRYYLESLYLAEHPEVRAFLKREKDNLDGYQEEERYNVLQEPKVAASEAERGAESSEKQYSKYQGGKLPPRYQGKFGGVQAVAGAYQAVGATGGTDSKYYTYHSAAQDMKADYYEAGAYEADADVQFRQHDTVEQYYPHEELYLNMLDQYQISHQYSQQQIGPIDVENRWQRLEYLNQSLYAKKQQIDKIYTEYYLALDYTNANTQAASKKQGIYVAYTEEGLTAGLPSQQNTSSGVRLHKLGYYYAYNCAYLESELDEALTLAELACQEEKNTLTERQQELITQYQYFARAYKNSTKYYEQAIGKHAKSAAKGVDGLANVEYSGNQQKSGESSYKNTKSILDSNTVGSELQTATSKTSLTKRYNSMLNYSPADSGTKEHAVNDKGHLSRNPLLDEQLYAPESTESDAFKTAPPVQATRSTDEAKEPRSLSMQMHSVSKQELLQMESDGTVSFEINPQSITENHVPDRVNEQLAMQVKFVSSQASSIYSDDQIETQDETTEQNDDYILQMIIQEENNRAIRSLSQDSVPNLYVSGQGQAKSAIPRFSSKQQLIVQLGGQIDALESDSSQGSMQDKKQLIVNALKDQLFDHIFNGEPTQFGQIKDDQVQFDKLLEDKNTMQAVLEGASVDYSKIYVVSNKIFNPQTIKTVAEWVPQLKDDSKMVLQTLYSKDVRRQLYDGKLTDKSSAVLKQLFFNDELVNILSSNPLTVKTFLHANFDDSEIKKAVQVDGLRAFNPAELASDLYNCLETAKVQDIQGQVALKLQYIVSSDAKLRGSDAREIKDVGRDIADILQNPVVLQGLLYQDIDKAAAKKLYVLLDYEKVYNLVNGRLTAYEIDQIIDQLADPQVTDLLVSKSVQQKLHLDGQLQERKQKQQTQQQLNGKMQQVFDPKTAEQLVGGELSRDLLNTVTRVLYDKQVAEIVANTAFSAACEAKISAVLYNPDTIKKIKQGDKEAIRGLAQAIYDPEVVKALSELLPRDGDRTAAKQCTEVIYRVQTKKSVLNAQPFYIETSVVRGQEILRKLEEQYTGGQRGELCSNIKISQNIDKGYTSKPVSPDRKVSRREPVHQTAVVFSCDKQAPSFIRSFYLPTYSSPQYQAPPLQQRVNNMRYNQRRKASPKNVACCIVGIASTPVRVNTGPAGGRYAQARTEQALELGEKAPGQMSGKQSTPFAHARSQGHSGRSQSYDARKQTPQAAPKIGLMMELPRDQAGDGDAK